MVIDASIAFKWLVPEADSPAALALLEGEHSAPALILSEVGNAFWKKAVREQLDPAVSLAPDLGQLPELVRIRDEAPHMALALDLARRLAHPIYDCVYLAMAEELGEQLMTADLKFAAKVRAIGLSDRVETLG